MSPPSLICNFAYSIFPDAALNSCIVNVLETLISPSIFPHISAFSVSIDPFRLPLYPTVKLSVFITISAVPSIYTS
jgi:hypothetical protein